jgi:hypothetical protein
VLGIGHPAREMKPVPEEALISEKIHLDRFGQRSLAE